MKEYPPIPSYATHFYLGYGYQPATVRKWEWSDTFGRWGAFVTFPNSYPTNGCECYTWPRLYYMGRHD